MMSTWTRGLLIVWFVPKYAQTDLWGGTKDDVNKCKKSQTIDTKEKDNECYINNSTLGLCMHEAEQGGA